MASESFEVTLTDEQLVAGKESAAARGVNLGPVGSMSRDLVTINYTVTSDGAGSNVIAVTVLYRPFYVPLETIQTFFTELLTPAPPAKESPAAASSHATSHVASAEPAAASKSGRRHE